MSNNCQNRKLYRSWEGKVKCWWLYNHKDLRFMFSPVVTECWKFVLFKPDYHLYIFKYTPVNLKKHFLSFPWWSLKMMKNFNCRHILASCQTRRMLIFDWLFLSEPPDSGVIWTDSSCAFFRKPKSATIKLALWCYVLLNYSPRIPIIPKTSQPVNGAQKVSIMEIKVYFKKSVEVLRCVHFSFKEW